MQYLAVDCIADLWGSEHPLGGYSGLELNILSVLGFFMGMAKILPFGVLLLVLGC